jgi:ADP-ribose pyrophosphatase
MTLHTQEPCYIHYANVPLPISATHANIYTDPGFCNTNLRMIHVTVDLSRPENQNPQPELEDNEFIETFSVPLKDLWGECIKFAEQGYVIDARVGTLAEGIEFAKRWKLV